MIKIHSQKTFLAFYFSAYEQQHDDINSVPMLAGMWTRLILTEVGCTAQTLFDLGHSTHTLLKL